MRIFIAICILLVAGSAGAQTVQVCSDYPTSAVPDLLTAKADVVARDGLKADTSNEEIQAYWLRKAVEIEIGTTIRLDAALGAEAQVVADIEEFRTSFPTPARIEVCGDSEIDTHEVCDDGGANSDTVADACRLTCVPAYCGDDVVDSGESCDDGGNGLCLDDCSGSAP